MKDIQKHKIWHILKAEGFTIKEYRIGSTLFGRGCILMPDYKKGFPYISVEPLTNGHWRLTIDYYEKSSKWEDSPFAIGKILMEKLPEFREFVYAQEKAENP